MAEIVRRRSWGGVLPLGRHASISGSSLIHCAFVSIAPSLFQERQNARIQKRFKLEQALDSWLGLYNEWVKPFLKHKPYFDRNGAAVVGFEEIVSTLGHTPQSIRLIGYCTVSVMDGDVINSIEE